MRQDSRFLKNNLSSLILNDILDNTKLCDYLKKLEGEISSGTISSTNAVDLMHKAYIESLKKSAS